MGQLNDLQIKATQPLAKEYLLADGESLHLRVRPTAKVWAYRYKQLSKKARLTFEACSMTQRRHQMALAQAGARDEHAIGALLDEVQME